VQIASTDVSANAGVVPSPLTVPPGPAAVSSPSPAPPVSVHPEVERRLVTALFCDLVGFTPLSGEFDPEHVRDLQAAYFGEMTRQIERYGGTVEKYAGDAVLALFGAPIAHEDDAERAVLCALGMQAAVAQSIPRWVADHSSVQWQVEPSIRVGVNTGEVVSGVWEVGGRQDVAVTGDAINTAARIQAAAEPGEVLVGSETMRLTRRRILYGERRELVLKGKIGAIPGYPAIGVREHFGERWETSDQATPLVGRDREMLELLDAWIRAQDGDGQLLALVGDAGVGKSRLISELLEKVATSGAVRVLRARCLSYGQEISLWLVADLLRALCGIREQDGLEAVRAALSEGISTLLNTADQETRAEAIDVLGEVLGLPPGPSLVTNAGPQIRRQALMRDLRLVLGALSERAPTILVLEDLHWIDGASGEVMTEVLSDVPGLRLLVLAAHRPGWTAPWSGWGWTERVSVRPLRDEEATLLAGAVLGGMTLSRELERYVADRAGGNPFFVEEMLRALQETGGLEQRGGQMYLAVGAAERLPSTLTEVLLARLDRLETHARTLAQVASVIGRSFAVRLLAQVVGSETSALDLRLMALQHAEIAFPRRGSDLEYVFKHVSMQEVAYNTLVQKRRQELHLTTARAIAQLYPSDEYVEMIAYHYARTDEHREAADWLERAGERAAAIYASGSAIANFDESRRRLLLVGDDVIGLARLDEKLGSALSTAGRYDQALEPLERAVEVYREARDLEAAGRATALLGQAHNLRGTPAEGLARIEPMLELLAPYGPSPALASLQFTLALLFFRTGRYEELLEAAQRGAEIARAIGNERLLASSEERRGTAFNLLGQNERAKPVFEAVIPLLERVGELDRLQSALTNLGEAHRLDGDLEAARQYNERSLRVAERVGDPSIVAFSLMNLGEIKLFLGEWDDAAEDLQRAEEVLGSVASASASAAYAPVTLGRLLLWRGEWEEAGRQLERALSLAGKMGDRQALELVHLALAELEVLRGEPELAVLRLEPLTDRKGGHLTLIQTILTWAQLERGEVDRAEGLAEKAVRRGREQHEQLVLADALRVQGMVLTRLGRHDEAKQVLEEGLALARTMRYPYAEARTLFQLGMMHLQRHESPQARSRLQDALVIFKRLGAKKDTEQTEETLADRAPT
jgi:adenylate cyclase